VFLICASEGSYADDFFSLDTAKAAKAIKELANAGGVPKEYSAGTEVELSAVTVA